MSYPTIKIFDIDKIKKLESGDYEVKEENIILNFGHKSLEEVQNWIYRFYFLNIIRYLVLNMCLNKLTKNYKLFIYITLRGGVYQTFILQIIIIQKLYGQDWEIIIHH